MVFQTEQERPYAAPSNVINVLARARSRNLPEVVGNDFLRLADVPEAVYGRVTKALRFLALVEEDGRPSETLRAISAAPEVQYRELLSGVIRSAYREDFERIDPAGDPQSKIIDAFKPYQPRSQTQRMVILFLGLCREAGIPVLDVPRDRKMQSGRDGAPASRQPQRRAHPNPSPVAPSSARQQMEPPRPGIAFGVTDDDLAALTDDEFPAVWEALGKVMRARARVRAEKANPPVPGLNGNEDNLPTNG